MLVLTRKAGEAIHIGGNIYIRVIKTNSGGVRIGIEAPQEIPICRAELMEHEEAMNAVDAQWLADSKGLECSALVSNGQRLRLPR